MMWMMRWLEEGAVNWSEGIDRCCSFYAEVEGLGNHQNSNSTSPSKSLILCYESGVSERLNTLISKLSLNH